MEKQILIYLGDHQEKKDAIKRVLSYCCLPFRLLDDKDLKYTCGYLMQLEGMEAKQKAGNFHYESDLMLLKDIRDEDIAIINALLKKLDCKMDRKAMLTDYNRHWYLCDLIQEIEKEHQYFQVYDQLMALLQNALPPCEDANNVLWQAYQTAILQAYGVLQSQPEDINVLQQAYLNVQKAETAYLKK